MRTYWASTRTFTLDEEKNWYISVSCGASATRFALGIEINRYSLGCDLGFFWIGVDW